MRPKALPVVWAAAVALAAAGSAAGRQERPNVQVKLGRHVIDRFHSNSISISGLTGSAVDVRLVGAIDLSGRAYEWAPYKWRRLHPRQGVWHGVLAAPALPGIYQLRLRLNDGRKLITSAHWLERVFPHGTEARPSFATPAAVIRDYVAQLPGHKSSSP